MEINRDKFHLFMGYLGILILTLMFCSNVRADQQSLGNVPQSSVITLLQQCSNCTYVTLTEVYNSVTNQNYSYSLPFDKKGSDWVLNVDNSGALKPQPFPNYGYYYVYGVSDGSSSNWRYDLTITRSSLSSLYIDVSSPFVIVGFVLAFLLCLYLIYCGLAAMAGLFFVIQGAVLVYANVFVIGMFYLFFGVILIFAGERKHG